MIDISEEFNKGYDNYKPNSYKIEYFMTQKDYTTVMNAISLMWTPSNNSGHYTFMKQKLISSIRGHCIRVKINP